MQFPSLSQFRNFSIPVLPTLGLTDDEQAMILRLQTNSLRWRGDMLLSESYYAGEQVIDNLRIAVPQELEFLRTIVGWPAIAVDPIVERLGVDGFRLPTATDADEYLSGLWDTNGCEAEQSLAYTDALAMRAAYWSVGSPVEPGGIPNITVESPLNTAVLWDLRGYQPKAALQEYWSDDRMHGALLLPFQTIHMAQDDKGQWEIVYRDQHGFDFVPITRMANRPRTNNRDGRSEITPAMRSITDAACRTLLGLEVAREIYSVPQRVILGAAESEFQNTDGTPKTAWDTYITKVLGLERDDEGNLPELKQLQAYDPSVFTKLIDMYASQMAGMLAAVPQDLGLYTQGNPTSAEAGQVNESRRDRRAILKQKMFGPSLVQVIQNAVRFDNNGRLPEQYAHMATDWLDVSLATPGVTADAIGKQIASGAIPATSDVTLKRLGYSSVERRRLEQDRKREDGRQAARDIAASLIPRPQPEAPSGGPAAGQ